MSRSRTIVIPPRTAQDEPALVRQFEVPGSRTFGAAGTIRLATAADDATIDADLGIPDAAHGGVTVTTSQHLPGSVEQRGSAALDGDPTTAWSTAFGSPAGQWIEVQTAAPTTFDHLDLQLVADGRHSVPTQIQIEAGGQARTVDLPAITDQRAKNATVSVPVSFAPLTGSTIRVTITGARNVVTTEYHEIVPINMPVAVAELGIPGVRRAPVPPTMSGTCRTDLLQVDGRPIGIRLSGTTGAATALDPIDYQLCNPTDPTAPAPSLALDKGTHEIRSTPGTSSGIDVDGLVLGSEAGGRPMTLGPGGAVTSAETVAAHPAGGATVQVVGNGRTRLTLKVTGATPGSPFWLVLGESNNAGWQATIAGRDAGGSTLVDGYANGWFVHPTSSTFTVTLKWKPQETVWIALAISAGAMLLCMFLALQRRRRGMSIQAWYRDPEPVLANPLVIPGTATSGAGLVVGPVLAGLAGLVFARWWVGAVAALCVLAALLRPRLRFLLTVGAPAAVASDRALRGGPAVPLPLLQLVRLACQFRTGERSGMARGDPPRVRRRGRAGTEATARQGRSRSAERRGVAQRDGGDGAVTALARAFLAGGERGVGRLLGSVGSGEEAEAARPAGRGQRASRPGGTCRWRGRRSWTGSR